MRPSEEWWAMPRTATTGTTDERVAAQRKRQTRDRASARPPASSPEAAAFPLTRSQVPTAVANFAGDTAIRHWAEEANTIVRWSEFDRGGHFAALEAPDLLAHDIREFFSSLR
jgi:pimeloyl-ACP methyl ester carboxylesterase